MGLTDKQSKFVDEYAKTLNATQSAINAGYSKKTAYSQGSRLLKDVEIRNEIDRLLTENIMSAPEVLRRLTKIASSDLLDLYDDDLAHINLKEARKNGVSLTIKKLRRRKVATEFGDDEKIEIEMHDPLKALEMMAKYHELLVTKIRVDDWRSMAIEDIKAGRVDFETLEEKLNTDMATDLFRLAGVPVE